MSNHTDLIHYLSSLTITQGRRAGQPFDVLPWQRRFIRNVFKPGVSDASLSIGRGNGKTTLVAGLGAAALDGPLAVSRAETIICASSFEQARIAFDHVKAFLEQRHDLSDRSRWRVWDSANNAQIRNLETGATVKCIGSDPRRAHGLAPVLILGDEPAQWEHTTAERMVAALETAAGKQPFCRFLALGTRPADETHWFAKRLAGGADYAQNHAARPKDPKFQKRTWALANPSMRHMPDLEAAIRRDAEKAKQDPSALAMFEALRLNLGTSDVERSMLLDASTWQTIEGEAQATGRPVWGVDLGTSAAQSAVAAYWPNSGRLDCVAAFPAEPTLKERGVRDGVGRLYSECHRRGELILCGGAAVSVVDLVIEARERFGPPVAIASDRWREAELRDALQAAGIPPATLELRGMGYKDGAEDVRAFRRGCLEGKVTPVRSLLLRSAMAEARTVSDPAGNSKLAKNAEGGRRLRARDDAAAAGILAVAAGVRQSNQPSRRWRYAGVV